MSFFKSSFSPNLPAIRDVIQFQLTSLKNATKKQVNLTIQLRIQSLFDEAIKTLSSNIKSSLDEEHISKIVRKDLSFLQSLHKVSQIDKSIPQDSIEKAEYLFEQYHRLLNFFAHSETYPLSQHLKEPLEQDFLWMCLEAKNVDAQDFLFKNKNHEEIKRILLTGIQNEKEGAIVGFLELCKNSSSCQWAQQKLIELIETETHPQIEPFFVEMIKYEGHEYTFLFPTWLDWIKQDRSFAVSLLSKFYEVLSLEKHHQDFFKKMLDLALNGERKFQAYTILIRAIQYQVNESLQQLKKEHLGQTELLETSQIWLHNAVRWAELIEQNYDKTLKTIGDTHRTFKILSLAISSYLDLHLFLRHGEYSPLPKNQTDFFPRAEALLFGTKNNPLEQEMIREVSSNLLTNNIPVYQGDEEETEGIMTLGKKLPVWMRDCVYFSWTLENQLFTKLPNYLFDLRKAKFFQSSKQEERRKKKEPCIVMGTPRSSFSIIQIADFHCQKWDPKLQNMHMLWSYGEGGNLLFYEDEEKGLSLIIGQDTVEMTRSLLLEELEEGGYSIESNKYVFEPIASSRKPLEVSDRLIKKVLERDYGVPSENIYFVEQPYQFHLDMGMSYVGGRRFLVNDSVKAFELGLELFKDLSNLSHKKGWEKTLKKEREEALKRKKLEDQCTLDLEKQGFEVIRVPGVFTNPYENSEIKQRVNFFNFLTMRTPETPSKKVVYATGCPENFQTLFESLLNEHARFKADAIYYFSQKPSEHYLKLNGGLHCLTQVLEKKLVFN